MGWSSGSRLMLNIWENKNMGWSSGSRLMSEIIDSLKDKLPDDKIRQEVYEILISAFENFDCDTLNECAEEDFAFKEALKNASFFNDDEEDFDEDEDYGYSDEQE